MPGSVAIVGQLPAHPLARVRGTVIPGHYPIASAPTALGKASEKGIVICFDLGATTDVTS